MKKYLLYGFGIPVVLGLLLYVCTRKEDKPIAIDDFVYRDVCGVMHRSQGCASWRSYKYNQITNNSIERYDSVIGLRDSMFCVYCVNDTVYKLLIDKFEAK